VWSWGSLKSSSVLFLKQRNCTCSRQPSTPPRWCSAEPGTNSCHEYSSPLTRVPRRTPPLDHSRICPWRGITWALHGSEAASSTAGHAHLLLDQNFCPSDSNITSRPENVCCRARGSAQVQRPNCARPALVAKKLDDV